MLLAQHVASVGVDARDHLDRRRRGSPHRRRHLDGEFADVDELQLAAAAARDREHLLHEFAGAGRSLAHVAQHLQRARIETRRALEHLAVEQDRPQQVVEVVRDAARELAHGVELLPLAQREVDALARDRVDKAAGEAAQRRTLGAGKLRIVALAVLEAEHAPERALNNQGLQDRGLQHRARRSRSEVHRDRIAAGKSRDLVVREPGDALAIRPRHAEHRLPHEVELLAVVLLLEAHQRERARAEHAADKAECRRRGLAPVERRKKPLVCRRGRLDQLAVALALRLSLQARVRDAREIGEERQHLPVPRAKVRRPRARESDRADDEPADPHGQIHA